MITTDVGVKLEKDISETLALFTIKPVRGAIWVPGMFLQLSLTRKSASEPWLDSKPFSIASWGSETLRIIVRKEGKFTTELFNLGKEGFTGSMKYPLGSFYLNEPGKKVFLAGGAGISAFTSYLEFVFKKDMTERVIVYHSARSTGETLDSFYWSTIPDQIIVNTNITRSEEADNKRGRLTFEELKEDILDLESYEYYVCGPPGFNNYWVNSLSKEHLKVRSESWIV